MYIIVKKNLFGRTKNRTINEEYSVLSILYWIITIPLFIIASFSYNVADYSQYEISFYRIANDISYGYKMEYGYVFLEEIGAFFHLSFISFRAAYLAIALFILLYSIYDYTRETKKTRIIVVLLYFIYPYMLDAVQMRHFMATAIGVFCIRYLVDNSSRNYCKFIFGIIIAASQHSIAYLYLLFLVCCIDVPLVRFKKVISRIIIVETIFFMAVSSIGAINKLFNAILSALSQIRSSGNLHIEQTNAVYKYYLQMVFIYVVLNLITRDSEFYIFDYKTRGKFDLMCRISMVALCFVPFISINDHFARAQRGVLVITYLVFIAFSQYKGQKYLKKYVCSGIPFFLSILSFYMFLSKRSPLHWENVTYALLNNNYFIEKIQAFLS